MLLISIVLTAIALLIVQQSGQHKFDAPRIRAHLVESTERQRDADLAAAEKATPSSERQRLRDAAVAAHQARLDRIDDAVARFAELDGRTDITKVSRELTRILTEEGVDAALAYMNRQRPDILAEARAQQAGERERLRAKLQPLLSAADLQVNKGQTDAARAAYRELLALDPTWPDALESAAWFLFDQGYQSYYHGTLVNALADAEEAHTLATQLHSAVSTNQNAQRLLSATHSQMGDVLLSRGQGGDAAKVQDHFSRSLKLSEALLLATPGSTQAARDTLVSLERLGKYLAQHGQAGDADKALEYYARHLELGETLLQVNPGSARATRDVSLGLAGLGDFLAQHGPAGDTDRALAYYSRSLELSEALLRANPRSMHATRDVLLGLGRMGDFLVQRGQAGDADRALGYYARSLRLSEALLRTNPGSAQTRRDVSLSLNKLGNFLAQRGQAGDADKALSYFTRSLELRNALLQANPGSAQAARDVSVSLERLGDFLLQRGQVGDSDQALAHYTRSLEMSEALRQANPDSAQATRDVWVGRNKLGDFLVQRRQPGDVDKALEFYTRSLEMSEALRQANPGSAQATRDAALSLDGLGDCFAQRGQAGDADKALSYFTRSLELRNALLQANPGSAEATRDVSLSCERLGFIYELRGQANDADKALAYYTRCLELSEALLNANPGAALATRDVVMSHDQLAGFAGRRGDAKGAEKHHRANYDLLNSAIQRGVIFDPAVLAMYEELKMRFAK